MRKSQWERESKIAEQNLQQQEVSTHVADGDADGDAHSDDDDVVTTITVGQSSNLHSTNFPRIKKFPLNLEKGWKQLKTLRRAENFGLNFNLKSRLERRGVFSSILLPLKTPRANIQR